MSKKIYVGNMNYKTDEPTLRREFEAFGEVVSAKIVVDQFSGRSKGFAFSEMANDDDAKNAISSLNGKEVDGRPLKVNEAIDKNPRSGGSRGYQRRSY